MRKQYYFQPSKKGYYAWDIDKLVAKSKNLPVISIKLNNLKEIDENFWYQNSNTKPTCRSIVSHLRLINETDLQYPIILSKDGKVMDGMHRIAKALLRGDKEIKAVQFQEDLPPDFQDVQEDELLY